MIKIINNDSLIALKSFPDNYFDSVVTDPPYGLNFMGKKWDYQVPGVELWKEVFRVLKPGGHVLSFCGTRTYHRMVVNIEDAGFEIRDQMQWVYGSGFPKSLNISKAIDSKLGFERKVTGKRIDAFGDSNESETEDGRNLWGKKSTKEVDLKDEPASEEAKKWDGWGTALKPANEPICVARKPIEDTVADNVLKYGTGGINIDGCRIETDEVITNHSRGLESSMSKGKYGDSQEQDTHQTNGQQLGRFPSNIIFNEEGAELLDEQTGVLKSGAMTKAYEYTNNGNSLGKPSGSTKSIHSANEGAASRFFYVAKASQAERNYGLDGFKETLVAGGNQAQAELKRGNVNFESDSENKSSYSSIKKRQNFHPTIKPVSLMKYLVRLVTPKNGIVLDPFNGSGTTGIACKCEGFNYVGIDMESEYCKISEARIAAWNPDTDIYETKEKQIIIPNQQSLF